MQDLTSNAGSKMAKGKRKQSNPGNQETPESENKRSKDKFGHQAETQTVKSGKAEINRVSKCIETLSQAY